MAARAASRAVTRGAQFSAVCRVAGDPVSGTFPVRVQAFGRSLRGQLRLFSSAAAKDAGAEVFDHPDVSLPPHAPTLQPSATGTALCGRVPDA